jgi:hypothetical protein
LDAYVKNEQTRWHKIISENKIQLN